MLILLLDIILLEIERKSNASLTQTKRSADESFSKPSAPSDPLRYGCIAVCIASSLRCGSLCVWRFIFAHVYMLTRKVQLGCRFWSISPTFLAFYLNVEPSSFSSFFFLQSGSTYEDNFFLTRLQVGNCRILAKLPLSLLPGTIAHVAFTIAHVAFTIAHVAFTIAHVAFKWQWIGR